MQAVRSSPVEVRSQPDPGRQLDAAEPLGAGVDQGRHAADVLRDDQILHVHPESAQLESQAVSEKMTLQACFVAVRRFGREGLRVGVQAEIDCSGLERVSIIGVQVQRILPLRPGGPGEAGEAAAAQQRAMIFAHLVRARGEFQRVGGARLRGAVQSNSQDQVPAIAGSPTGLPVQP